MALGEHSIADLSIVDRKIKPAGGAAGGRDSRRICKRGKDACAAVSCPCAFAAKPAKYTVNVP